MALSSSKSLPKERMQAVREDGKLLTSFEIISNIIYELLLLFCDNVNFCILSNNGPFTQNPFKTTMVCVIDILKSQK